MDIQATKLELMQLLLETEREDLLKKVKSLFQEDQKDWWDQLKNNEKQEVEIGLKQIDENKVKSHDEVMKAFDQWK